MKDKLKNTNQLLDDFLDEIKDEPVKRRNAVEELYRYMTDEGRFSILLLGLHGVGKTFWIDKIVEFIQDNDKALDYYMSKIIRINCCICANKDEYYWNEIFEKADGGIIIFDYVEYLDQKSQFILFEILSTNNGKFGYLEKKFACRVIFTSSLKIESLRDLGSPLAPNFFGRISNFVVKLPDFTECSNYIEKDFAKSWNKMCYPDPYNEIPSERFITWIKENAHKFHGNFRDLDNLTMNWHNCKVNGYSDEDTFKIVKETFEKLNHYPEHNTDFKNFTINSDMDYYNEILPNFKAFVKEYAKRLYGKNLKNAPNGKPFGVPYRTMDRW